jgi:hypothetical protein
MTDNKYNSPRTHNSLWNSVFAFASMPSLLAIMHIHQTLKVFFAWNMIWRKWNMIGTLSWNWDMIWDMIWHMILGHDFGTWFGTWFFEPWSTSHPPPDIWGPEIKTWYCTQYVSTWLEVHWSAFINKGPRTLSCCCNYNHLVLPNY